MSGNVIDIIERFQTRHAVDLCDLVSISLH
jgi:hypothetical protein